MSHTDNGPTNALPLDAPMTYVSEFSASRRKGDCWTWNVSSLRTSSAAASLVSAVEGGDGNCALRRRVADPGSMRVNMSIFSSFSSKRSFNSLTSASNARTRSSNDSVYPRGKALRLSLSLVLHSNPTLEHCEQHGRMPSQRIFLLLHLSQACAIRLCAVVPNLIVFIGRMPGMMSNKLNYIQLEQRVVLADVECGRVWYRYSAIM